MADTTKEAKLPSLIGYENLANNIVSELLSISTDSNVNNKHDPRSIAITGDWGMGKSHLIELIKEKLLKKTDKKIKIIDYDPWKMAGNKNNELGILREILSESGSLEDRIYKSLVTSNSTFAEISGKGLLLAIFIPIILGCLNYLWNSFQLTISGSVGLGEILITIFILRVLPLLLFLTLYIGRLLYIKPDFNTIKEYIREDTISTICSKSTF